MTDAIYRANLAAHSDIREHLGLLKGLAMECDLVVELGFRTGVSTSAFLAAHKPNVISYDLMPSPQAKLLACPNFDFRIGDSRTVDIPKCDLLFIDTDHTEATTRLELAQHFNKVRRWIVLHDTETFGRRDRAPGKGKGILAAVDEFLESWPWWTMILQIRNNNGLTILERGDHDSL
jgi:hypothetical protein